MMLDLKKPICTKNGRRCELIAVLPPEKAVHGHQTLVVLVNTPDPALRTVDTYSMDGRLFPDGRESTLDLINAGGTP